MTVWSRSLQCLAFRYFFPHDITGHSEAKKPRGSVTPSQSTKNFIEVRMFPRIRCKGSLIERPDHLHL